MGRNGFWCLTGKAAAVFRKSQKGEPSDCRRQTLKASTRRGVHQIRIRYDIQTDRESIMNLGSGK